MIKKPVHVTINRELYEKAKIYGINLSQTLEEALNQKLQNLGIEISKNYKKDGWIVRCPHCKNEFKTLSLFPFCPKCRVHFLILIKKKKQWILKERIVKIPKEVFPIFLEKVKKYYPQLYEKIKDLDISQKPASPQP